MIRLFRYIIIIGLFLSLKPEEKINTLSVEVLSESSLYIRGTSNIKNFICKYSVDQMNNPVSVVYEHNGNALEFRSASLVLNTAGFYCGSRGINEDLRDLLRVDLYPIIELYPEKVVEIPNISGAYKANIRIHMVGKSKTYPVILEVESGGLRVMGILRMDIRDFGLEPPKKALGLIKVSPFIEIHFQLKLKTC